MDFIHLHNHTQYSLLDGACLIDKMIDRAKQFNMPALAITDHGNMFGVIDFYKKCLEKNIKPIIGCEIYLAENSRFEKAKTEIDTMSYHLVLLAKNQTGYQNLIKIVSIGYLEGFYYKPRVDLEILSQFSEGIIALSACLAGKISKCILTEKTNTLKETIEKYLEIFSRENFYLELMYQGIPEQKKVNRELIELSKKYDIKTVATNDCHYIEKQDSRIHDVLLCIQTGKKLADDNRLKFPTDEFYFKAPQEMKEIFKEQPDALKNTIEIAEKINLFIELGKTNLPKFKIPEEFLQNINLETEEEKEFEYLKYLTYKGAKKKLEALTEKEEKRINYELEIIRKTGFSGYFLIVSDFVNYAKASGIMVGPGRGSCVGSMVSYCLDITDINPLDYNLLFERFLNLERIQMPDMDIDFEPARREEVVNYLKKTYSKECVANIITFTTMKISQAIQDISRVKGLSFNEGNFLSKLIKDSNMKVAEAIAAEPKLKDLIASDEKIKFIFEIADKIIGIPRQTSVHAAGHVIANKPLMEYVPLYYEKNKDLIITQYNMHNVEDIGLLKIDLLVIELLTTIKETVDLVNQGRKIKLEITRVKLDDKKTYKLISEGNTIGVFQLGRSGMRQMLQRMKPQCFSDIIAANALYRPGPLNSGMVDDYIERKNNNKKFDYIFEELKPILEETYGTIVYQEQIMQIAFIVAGYSLGEADTLRKAMGKKEINIMESQKEEFIKRAIQRGFDKNKVEKLFEDMLKFAEYGFNKSHSAAYSFLAYQTAYLKAHYTLEFMSATLTTKINTQKKQEFIEMLLHCKELGINLLKPDINKSMQNFSIESENIRYALSALKNVGGKAAKEIVNKRNKLGKFISYFDFCKKVDTSIVNKKCLESLIKAGAFDEIEENRAYLLSKVEKTLELVNKEKQEKEKGLVLLFKDNTQEYLFKESKEEKQRIKWDKVTLLKNEKEIFGFSFSGDILEKYTDFMLKTGIRRLREIDKDEKNVKIAGIIEEINIKMDKNNKPIAWLKITDSFWEIEGVVFASIFEKYGKILEKDKIYIFTGNIQNNFNKKSIIINRILEEEKLYFDSYNRIEIYLKGTKIPVDKKAKLDKLIRENPGNVDIYIVNKLNRGSKEKIGHKIKLNKNVYKGLKDLFGENIKIGF